MRAIGLLQGALLSLFLGSGAAYGQCLGDCDGDGRVSVSELVRGVNIALGTTPLSNCPAFDDGSGTVTVSSLVRAVNYALDGCPGPTPTPTQPQPTGTPTTTTEVFYGDLHVHSMLSMPDITGNASPADVFTTARDQIGLDFMALSDHDSFLTQEEWDEIRPTAASFDDPGSFVAFSAIEWTHRWHMNIVYRSDDVQFCDCIEGFQFNDAYRGLIQAGAAAAHVNHPKDVFLPDWSMVDDTVTTNVEVWNAASSDLEIGFSGTLWALRAGFRFGLVGVSDDHRTDRADPLIGKGITGCHAAELTRDALLGALRQRRCFATTGERIVADMEIEGAPMGAARTSRLGLAETADIRVTATAAPVTIELVKNGVVIDQTTCESVDCEAEIEFVLRDPSTFVYARIEQSDGGRAWTSPIWIDAPCPADQPTCLESRLAPGAGGFAANDCLAEFLAPEDAAAAGWDLAAGTVTCSDGDPSCDAGETSGECLIELGLCFRVEDSRRPGCTPQRASAFEVVQPADDTPRRSADWENRRTLQAIFQAAHTSDDKNPCSPLSRLRVPAGETKIFEIVTAAGQTQDLDTLTVECRPE